MKIIIEPKTQRAKNRVNEHGEVMELMAGKIIEGKPAILCRSMNDTWRNEKWMGWFDIDDIHFDDNIKMLMRNF